MRLLDPVRIVDIARRAGAARATAEGWTQQATFPRPQGKTTPYGEPLWEWRGVEQWLIATNRLPGALRYRTLNGHHSMRVETAEPHTNGGTQWTLQATFVGSADTGYRAIPADALKQETDEPRAAAQRLLDGWDTARAAWVRDHPNEPMPAHLVGSPWPLDPEPEGELAARLVDIDTELGETP